MNVVPSSIIRVSVLILASISITVMISYLMIDSYSLIVFGQYSFTYLVSVFVAQFICLGLPEQIIKTADKYHLGDELFIWSLFHILVVSFIIFFLLVIFKLFIIEPFLIVLTSITISYNNLCSAYLRLKGFTNLSQLSEGIFRNSFVFTALLLVKFGVVDIQSQKYQALLLYGVISGLLFQSSLIFLCLSTQVQSALSKVSLEKFLRFLKTRIIASLLIYLSSLLNQSTTVLVIIISGPLVSYNFLGELRLSWQVASLMFVMLQVTNIVYGVKMAKLTCPISIRNLLSEIQKILLYSNGTLLILIIATLGIYGDVLIRPDIPKSTLYYLAILVGLAMIEVSIGPVGQFLIMQGKEQHYFKLSISVYIPALVFIIILLYLDLIISAVFLMGISRIILKVFCRLQL